MEKNRKVTGSFRHCPKFWKAPEMLPCWGKGASGIVALEAGVPELV